MLHLQAVELLPSQMELLELVMDFPVFLCARGTPGLPIAAEQQVAMHAESLYIDSISVFVILLSHFMNGSFRND